MPTTPEGFQIRVAQIQAQLVEQGRRVQAMLETAADALFSRDVARAKGVVSQDDAIDRTDVEIERASVALLGEACRDGANLSPDQLRAMLTVVKINNELERVADEVAGIAEAVGLLGAFPTPLPDTFRVVANSVVGILRDVCSSYDRQDARLAKIVLQSQDAAAAFKRAIMRDAEVRIAAGQIGVDFAFLMQEVATRFERIADHCTNIAEQVIYAATGAIVRHEQGHWVEVDQGNA